MAVASRPETLPRVHLIVLHHHFRPGGVRRVIELAVPALVGALQPRVGRVVLVSGEPADALWLENFRARLGALPVWVRIEPALGYVSARRIAAAHRAKRARQFLSELLETTRPQGCVVWAHNQSLGRNLPASRELLRACTARQIPLVLHHHDWWFDNRWRRWPEMRRSGFHSLAQVAAVLLAPLANVRHAAINQADATILQRHFGSRATWLPNPADPELRPTAGRQRFARDWLTTQLGEKAPVWLMPCRLLRRKNVAEALLLTRWLRPEAWLVTTGAISSPEEAAYARQLESAAKAEGWKLCLGLLAGGERNKPSVPELLAASEAVLLTSLLEGFGLPYLEAAAARRPLIARSLPNIAPDLARLDFCFPQSYDEIFVAPSLFDWSAERARQQQLWLRWRAELPRNCRALASQPALLVADLPRQPVPFSRLTLAAQLEILRQPLCDSWRLCAPLNPVLPVWRAHAARTALRLTRWPPAATTELSVSTYATRFGDLLNANPSAQTSRSAGSDAQAALIREKLRGENLYPLLWSPVA